MAVVRRLLAGFAVTMLALIGTAPSAVTAADPLANVPFAVGTETLFDEAGSDGRQGTLGKWSLVEGHVANGRLRLHLTIEPPAQHGLPVRSGPAVLFAGMDVFGGSGDVGFDVPMDALATEVLPACHDDPCRYSADIDLPTAEIPGAIRRLGKGNELEWVSVEMTLVRTFGDGQWLQVMPFLEGPRGAVSAKAGRLGAIKPVTGGLFPIGLFQASQATPVKAGTWMFTTRFDYGKVVERLRKEAGDASTAIPTVVSRVHVRISPGCQGGASLTLHDEAGDGFYTAIARGKTTIDGTMRIPIGVPVQLTLDDGGGIDFDQGRRGWGIRTDPVVSDGSPLAIDAAFDCGAMVGTISTTGPVSAPAPAVTPVPAIGGQRNPSPTRSLAPAADIPTATPLVQPAAGNEAAADLDRASTPWWLFALGLAAIVTVGVAVRRWLRTH